MSRPDQGYRTIPARRDDFRTIPASNLPVDPIGLAIGPDRRSRFPTVRLAWRAIRRHWWQAIGLWVAGSLGLMALADRHARPSFEASATIKVDPGDRGPASSSQDFEVFKETQVNRVASPPVISRTLADHPELRKLPSLAGIQDPEAWIRRSIRVTLVPRTNLIRVAVASESAGGSARIVDAVIEAYLKVAIDPVDEEIEKRRGRLREAKEERAAAVRQKRDTISALVARVGAVDGNLAKGRDSVTIEQYGLISKQLLQTDLELVEARARFDRLKDAPEVPRSDNAPEPEADLVAAFYDSAEATEARVSLEKARENLAQAERFARNGNDPARQSAQKRVDEAQTQLDILWTRMGPSLGIAVRKARRESETREAEGRLAEIKKRSEAWNDRLEKLNDQTKAAGSAELSLEFARQDLGRAEAVLDTVTKTLDQVEFEARGPVARFHQEYPAMASDAAATSPRVRLMAAAPVGMLLTVVGFFVMVELRAGRVHDPEEIPGRLRLPVIGVVPTLPKRGRSDGSVPGQAGGRSRRDLDQFIQSLDHLRVAICSGGDSRARSRRSVLITSACAGEGKTTLAAQLAERCVNAGLTTLLIDADIRNPSLSRMFDQASNQGLINVLQGESMAESVISVIEAAGGFHFLPAGSPRVDPSRLLQGEALARLLASARESFDVVLVDSPPILPVPDALTIGRWVDGAVLAVRFDSSRFPQVERANRRLVAVNIPVIGAVINGVRGAEAAYYGSYDPAYGATVEPDDSPRFRS